MPGLHIWDSSSTTLAPYKRTGTGLSTQVFKTIGLNGREELRDVARGVGREILSSDDLGRLTLKLDRGP